MNSDDTVKLSYSSSKNITFRGTIETGISRADWDAMSEEERDNFIAEELSELVQICEVED